MSATLRRLARRLGLVGLGTLAALGLAEGALRVAAHVDPRVRLLATGRATRPSRTYRSLEEFVRAQSAHIAPHRPWYNHWSNAFGFHDEEFVEPKPPGRFRVLTVGDSFTFGPLPYPQGVMTLTEAGLRAACGGRDLDLLNMGVMGAGVPEYRILLELAAPRFAPDLVLVNFFAGNDGPDLHRHVHDRSPAERVLHRSHTWTFVKNFLRVRGALRDTRLPERVQAGRPPAGAGRGGTPVDPARPLSDDDPALVGPLLSEDAFQRVLASDLGHLYRPGDEQEIRAAWQPVLAELDGLRRAADRAGARLVLAFLPSVLQVDDTVREAVVARLAGSLRYRGLSSTDIDPRLPNTVLEAYARTHGIGYVDLTPVFVAAAGGAHEPLYRRNDNHWAPHGNRIAARALATFLAPLVCPR